MAHIFNPIDILNKMQTTFTMRIANDNSITNKNLNKMLKIQIEEQTALFQINKMNVNVSKLDTNNKNDGLPVIKLTQREFTALIFGYVSAEDLEVEGWDDISEEEQGLINILFPETEPVWDYFAKY